MNQVARYVAKGINVSCRTILGTSYIYREDTRELHELDGVGSFIWDMINGVTTEEEIILSCINFFEGKKEEILTTVAEFLLELKELGVVVTSDIPFKGVMISAC